MGPVTRDIEFLDIESFGDWSPTGFRLGEIFVLTIGSGKSILAGLDFGETELRAMADYIDPKEPPVPSIEPKEFIKSAEPEHRHHPTPTHPKRWTK